MTGPEHYAEAERLLYLVGEQGQLLMEAASRNGGKVADVKATTDMIAAVTQSAQVHAMLALAAASALEPAKHGMVAVDPWLDVAS